MSDDIIQEQDVPIEEDDDDIEIDDVDYIDETETTVLEVEWDRDEFVEE